VPVCGTPGEVLGHHRLSAAALAERLVAAARSRGLGGEIGDVAAIRSRGSADAPIG
jgi:hypothetical protein